VSGSRPRTGPIGDQHLREFQDNEKTVPTILTTSQKLSTGVDARNVRNIVLMRPVNSMIEFKQIIGRGTRLFDGKDYFTILDFVKAYEHFNDSEWDGEPLEPAVPKPRADVGQGNDDAGGDVPPGDDEDEKRKKIVVKLADGKERTIQHMMATSFWGPDGRPISAAQFVERLFGDLPAPWFERLGMKSLLIGITDTRLQSSTMTWRGLSGCRRKLM
jgi:type I restriction enzyme, R subunit